MIDIGTDQPGHSLRMLVAESLKKYDSSVLVSFLKDKDCIVQTAAARELQTRGECETIPFAKNLLSSETSNFREIGAFILGQLGTPDRPFQRECCTLLKRALKNEEMPAVRATIIAAIAKRKDIETLRTCLKFSADKSPSVRAAVVFAIGCNGKGKSQVHRQGCKILQALSKDQSPLVRSYVKMAHEMIEET